jgi:Putative phage metallopeptidase
MANPRNWPKSITAIARKALESALVMDPEYAEWPEGEKVLVAKQPQAIAEVLIKAHHPHLTKRVVAYLWAKEIAGSGKVVLGKASKASAKIRFLAGVDFVIDVNWTAWKALEPRQRVALMDHELAHLAVDGETLAPMVIPHDVEEFGVIVERRGLWKSDLEGFGRSVARAQQGDLFVETGGNGWDEGPPKVKAADVEPIAAVG